MVYRLDGRAASIPVRLFRLGRSHAMASFYSLVTEVRACTICEAHLPLGPRPVFQLHPNARILIAGQAPGKGFMNQACRSMTRAEIACASGWVWRAKCSTTRSRSRFYQWVSASPDQEGLETCPTTRVCTCLAQTTSRTASPLGGHNGAWPQREGLLLRQCKILRDRTGEVVVYLLATNGSASTPQPEK